MSDTMPRYRVIPMSGRLSEPPRQGFVRAGNEVYLIVRDDEIEAAASPPVPADATTEDTADSPPRARLIALGEPECVREQGGHDFHIQGTPTYSAGGYPFTLICRRCGEAREITR